MQELIDRAQINLFCEVKLEMIRKTSCVPTREKRKKKRIIVNGNSTNSASSNL